MISGDGIDRTPCMMFTHDPMIAKTAEEDYSLGLNLGLKDHVASLSPNDNKLHGCKSNWKEEYYKFESGVSASLRLMNPIDLESETNATTYFRNNLFNVKTK